MIIQFGSYIISLYIALADGVPTYQRELICGREYHREEGRERQGLLQSQMAWLSL